ncbi:MAG: hypothetical protein ACREOQ_20975 [Gemmatimonadales bacterium]
MHDAKIEYCHWKSNEHLGASIRGETDLDILVARRDVCCLAQVLGGTRFKRCLTAPARQYPGIESYVGLDEETGRLIHLHVHYQLTVGERHLKGYRVPWEHLVLARRVYRETEGLYVVDPELELLLLVIRAALKLRNRDLIRAWVLGKEARPDMVREFHWLASRVDREELAGVADRLVGSRAAQLVGTMVVEARVTPRALARLRGALAPGAQEYRTYAAFGARCRRWMRELLLVGAPRLRLPQGGAVVVVVGADGSGKSTVVRELTRWLSNNLDATSMYLGSGQGPVSMPRQALQRAAAVFKRVRPSAKASAPYRRRGEGLSRLRTAGELLWVASLAVERRRRAAAVRRARNRGTIVLCDRFPQSQTAGNDGPWLGHWLDHSGWARRTVARQELASLRCVERLRPDLVIKLAVTREVAALRKPETAPHLLDTRLQVLEQLRFDPESRVVELDATRPLERVLLEAKREIWSML